MRTRASQEGYLMIDHRASPGIPEDVARSIGLDPKLAGEGKLLEAATMTCSHCKAAVVKNPFRVRERASCPKCGYHYICDFCAEAMTAADYMHAPFNKVVDDMLTAAAKGFVLGSPRDLLAAPAPALVIPPDSKG